MLLSKPEQDQFFSNYLPLLYYAAMYEGLLPEAAVLMDFGHSSLEIKVQSRDALFTDSNILRYFLMDNGKHLTKEGVSFLKSVEQGMLSNFVVLRQYKKYGVLMHPETGVFYEVVNITEQFSKLLSYIPTYITTALFNFNGKIICDGLFKGGNMNIGPNNEKSFLEKYHACKADREVVTLL